MWYIVLFAVLLLIDQATKIIVAMYSGVAGSAGGEGTLVKTLIPDFLDISYCENKNGMMSLFSKIADDNTRYWIFIISSAVIMLAIFLYLVIAKNKGKWNTFALTMILAGAVGNFIDRVLTVYVRDFIHVILTVGGKEIFPYIFNVADMAVVVGAIMLIIGMLFIGKDAIFGKKKKDEDGKEKTDGGQKGTA